MKKLLFISFMFFCISDNMQAQQLTFQYLEEGEITENCTSISDPNTNVQCYAVRYTPSGTGTLTSYTLGFLGSCPISGFPYLEDNSSSCIMEDNSTNFDACNTNLQKFLLQLSGNSGTTAITSGLTITVHQMCFDVPLGDTIVLEKDETSGHTFSIDPAGGGDPFTDVPSYTTEIITNEFSCEESNVVCSVNFGSLANKLSFSAHPNGNIVDASSLVNSFSTNQSFDIYDETTMSCISPGGLNDITFDFQILNTIDINSNGLLDTLVGSTHNIRQGDNGIEANIPFNMDSDSKSTPGDIRGYSIEVRFEDHIGIIADQLTVHLDGINTAGLIFESSAIIFQDQNRNDYGSVIHNGFYGGENDLSGNCDISNAGNNFEITGSGVVVFQDTTVVDKTMPCNIGLGIDGSQNSPSISARMDAGLDSAAVISGFRLVVYGEDIATSTELDDGSGTTPDDGTKANTQTNSSMLLQSSITGISIKGCVFQEQIVLPLDFKNVEATQVDKDNVISWITANEINTDIFEIEWSKDGEAFEGIGSIKSNNTDGLHTYKWTHNNPAHNLNYYRVKQIDLDGRFIYSEIVNVLVRYSNKFSVYPNPASQVLYINRIADENQITIKVFDSSGRLVLNTKTSQNNIDISTLNDGLHHINISSKNQNNSINFLKKSR